MCSVIDVYKQEMVEEVGTANKNQLMKNLTGCNREFTFYPQTMRTSCRIVEKSSDMT